MKKIMFNDRYGLTNAVISMRKTQTRRVEPDTRFENVAEHADSLEYEDGYIVAYCDGREVGRHKCNYKVGEVVAVAQRYSAFAEPDHKFSFVNANGISMVARADQLEGWHNKMYVLADLMPYRIRITGVKAERIQDISADDCLEEGIIMEDDGISPSYYFLDCEHYAFVYGRTPIESFESLISRVSGRQLWSNNKWVIAYEFQLVM